jgi:hypothetical protein
MARRISQKAGADAAAMLDREHKDEDAEALAKAEEDVRLLKDSMVERGAITGKFVTETDIKQLAKEHLAAKKAGPTPAPRRPQVGGRKKGTPSKQQTTVKADLVRAYLLKNPTARPIEVSKATGVEAAYVWDIRQVMRRAGLIAMPEPTGKAASK